MKYTKNNDYEVINEGFRNKKSGKVVETPNAFKVVYGMCNGVTPEFIIEEFKKIPYDDLPDMSPALIEVNIPAILDMMVDNNLVSAEETPEDKEEEPEEEETPKKAAKKAKK